MRTTGKWAYIEGIPCVQNWGFGKSSNVARYQASCAPESSVAVEGNINIAGSFGGIGYLPPFPTGDDYAAILVASAAPGAILNYEADILVTDVTINIPIAGGGPISWSGSWGMQGNYTLEEATAHEDDTRIPGPPAKNAKLSIETTPDAGIWADIGGVQNISLVFRRGVTEYAEGGYVYREAGNLEADISFDIVDTDLTVPEIAINGTKRVRVYVDATDYFEYDAVMFREHTNYNVSRTNNALVGFSGSGYFTALRTRATPALGYIKLPDDTYLYGAAPGP